MKSISLRSPAKLNLFLKVINKRPDNYHNIETLFERIDLHDDIQLVATKEERIKVVCDHPQVPKGPKNLVYRVAKVLKDQYGVKGGVEIRIVKRIPVAAGLAGGSSNAATVLCGLNRLWRLSLSREQLLQHAKEIGSDVPFFLYDCRWAVGAGRGDQIKRVSIDQKLWHVLVVPCIKMYSGEVFSNLNFELTRTGANVSILLHYLQKKDLLRASKFLLNDLSSSILHISPQLLKLVKRLSSFGLLGVVFSGSGPAVLGLARSKREAETVKASLSKLYSRVYVVRTW